MAKDEFTRKWICEFLAFLKIGTTRKRQRKYRALEALNEISERNSNSLKTFLEHLFQSNLSSHTQMAYKHRLRQYFKYSNEVSKEQIKRYIATIEEKGRKPQTIALFICAMNSYADFMKHPEWKTPRPKITRKLDVSNIPTEAEYRKVTGYLKERRPEYYLQVRLLAATGARVSELLQFTYEDVLKGSVDLKGKGNKYRRFFFPNDLVKEIVEYSIANRQTGLVFINHKTGEPLSARGWNSRLHDIARWTGVDEKKMHSHAFRHFFAKMYLNKNKDVVQLSELLGHESIDTTRIYLQKSFDEQKNDFNKHVTW
jgi:site-specific recombinase XerD